MLKRIHIKIYGTSNFHLIYPSNPNTIISNGDSIGAIIILSEKDKIGEMEEKTAQTIFKRRTI